MKSAALLALAAASGAHATADLVWLDQPWAQCLDGSPTGYYVDWSPTGSDNFTIMLEGGGECATADSCWDRVTSNMGSSNYFPETKELFQLQDRDPAANPHFNDWNHIYVPYCSGDLWAGQMTQAVPETFDLAFAGHLNLVAALDHLVENTGIGSADNIILTGESAGGIGLMMQVDYMASRFPDAQNVVAAPIAGFYFEAIPYTGPYHTSSSLMNFSASSFPEYYSLYDAYVDDGCRAALPTEPWRCMLANNSYPFVETPLFVIEAQTDQVVLLYHDWVPDDHLDDPNVQAYVKGWAGDMTSALSNLDPSNGYFNPACFIHTSFYHGQPQMDSLSYDDALVQWMSGEPTRIGDECGIFCNPTCPDSQQ